MVAKRTPNLSDHSRATQRYVLAKSAIAITAVISLITGCQPISPQPEQATTNINYVSHCLEHSKAKHLPGRLYGFGGGASLAAAKQTAMADIAQQLSVRVKSRNKLQTTKINTAVVQEFNRTIHSNSEAQLNNLKLQCLDTDKDQYYVRLMFDGRPTSHKLADAIAAAFPGRQVQLKPSLMLSQSPFLTRLQPLLVRQGPAYPVESNIAHHNGQWMLELDHHQLPLPKSVFSDLLPTTKSPPIYILDQNGQRLTTNLKNHQEYRWQINSAKKYVNIIAFYDNGETQMIRQNVKMAANTTIPTAPAIFEAQITAGYGLSEYYAFIFKDKAESQLPNSISEFIQYSKQQGTEDWYIIKINLQPY